MDAHDEMRATLTGADAVPLDLQRLELLHEFSLFYTELAQLVNGCKQDWQMSGSWSEWDESVLTRLRDLARRIDDTVNVKSLGNPP